MWPVAVLHLGSSECEMGLGLRSPQGPITVRLPLPAPQGGQGRLGTGSLCREKEGPTELHLRQGFGMLSRPGGSVLSDPPTTSLGTTPHPNCFPAAPRQRGTSHRAVLTHPAMSADSQSSILPSTHWGTRDTSANVQGQLAGHTQVLRMRNLQCPGGTRLLRQRNHGYRGV